MARHWFGQSLTDWTFTAGEAGAVTLSGAAEITFWAEPDGGAQYTDLQDANGLAISSVTSSDGTTLPLGTIPQFVGPEGVTYMWADTGGGTRYMMVATDIGDEIAAILARVATLEATVTQQQTLLTYALYGIKYDAGAGAYPPIPAALAGQQYLIFVGPPTPTTARAKDLHIDTVD